MEHFAILKSDIHLYQKIDTIYLHQSTSSLGKFIEKKLSEEKMSIFFSLSKR